MGVIPQPAAEWVAQQPALCSWPEDRVGPFRLLVRDRDATFTAAFDAVSRPRERSSRVTEPRQRSVPADHWATSGCWKLASQQRLSPTGADSNAAMSNDVIV